MVGAMTETVNVEIRSGEGGDHAKHLVKKMASIYERYADRRSL